MNFLAGLAKAAAPKPAEDQPKTAEETEKSAAPDLFASAKLVADAAQAQFSNQSDKYEKTKVAGAAAELIDAASEYGKIDQTQGLGKYVGEAEEYLRKYSSSGEPAAVAAPPAAATAADPVEEKTAPADEKKAPAPTSPPVDEELEPAPSAAADPVEKKAESPVAPAATPAADPEDEKVVPKPTAETTEVEKPSAVSEAAETGDYAKLAGDFLNKASVNPGDAIKVAQGFFGKKSGESEEETEAPSETGGGGGFGGLGKLAGGGSEEISPFLNIHVSI